MVQRYRGSCLCGQIVFDVTGFSDEVAACHCTMCRKFHGAAFGTLVEVQGLRWLSGKALLKDYAGDNGTVRKFCNHCGTSLAFLARGLGDDQLELAISMFDDEIPIKIDVHIYTDYKANWFDPPGDIQHHKEGRGS